MPFTSPEQQPKPHLEFASERLEIVDKIVSNTERALHAMGVPLEDYTPILIPNPTSTTTTPEQLIPHNPLHIVEDENKALDQEKALGNVYHAFEQPLRSGYDQEAA